MHVRDIELQPLVGAHPDESLADAADRMRFYEVGSLAVIEHGTLVAIITERDLARAVADRVDPAALPVRFYMTSDPTTVSADSDVQEAASLMLGIGTRHLPVMDAGELVGMLSIRDLLVTGLVRA